MSRPLDGVRVLDFTRVYSGPYATLLLSDMGAEVIKVEHPAYGDDARAFGPFTAGTSGYFETLNRGKKSIAIDYRRSDGQQLLHDLTAHMDIVIENFRPGQMKRYNLDDETLCQFNPRLIYASISGYGQQTSLGAYDIVVQAASGLMSLTGLPDLPIKTGPAIADAISGLTAAVALLGALYRRERTGEGAYVDISMVDAVFAVLENALADYSVTGETSDRRANTDSAIAPFDCFPARDGWIVLAAGNEKLWQSLVTVVGSELEQSHFATNTLRLQHSDELHNILAEWCQSMSSADLLNRLHAAGIPSGTVRTIDELAADPRLEARDMLLKLTLDDGETIMVPGSPIHISGTDRPATQRAPKLGEHTAEILQLLEKSR